MTDKITFTLDGRDVTAEPGETIWQVAKRHDTEIPHLCWSDEPGYRADGNCRACMVEVEGERVLAASCIRTPTDGMVVKTGSERATKARAMVFEMLLADQPDRETGHDPESRLWDWSHRIGQTASRLPARETPAADPSHPAMAVNLDACIHCNLCVRACREVQVNDVIGMAGRGHGAKIVFDMDDPMGTSTCVACGECVQACPTGALMPANLLDDQGTRTEYADRQVHSVCPYCGVGCQLTFNVKDNKLLHVDGRPGPANENRLCVKGRFGFDYIHHPHRLTVPLIRREDVAKDAYTDMDPSRPLDYFREATWEEALDAAARGLRDIRDERGSGALAGFGSAKGSNEEAYLFQKLVRTGFGTNNVDHCTRLCHASSVAALMQCIELRRRHRALHRLPRFGPDDRHRREPDREPPGRRHLLQAGGQAGRGPGGDGPTRPGAEAACHPHVAVQARQRCRHAERAPERDHRGGALRPAVCGGADDRLRAAPRAHQADFTPRRCQRSAASTPRNCAPSPASTPAPRRRSSSGAWAFPSTSTAPTTPAA